MDDVWLQAVASKDSLFATEWPLSAWAVNLGTLGVLWLAYRCRAARGRAGAEERGARVGRHRARRGVPRDAARRGRARRLPGAAADLRACSGWWTSWPPSCLVGAAGRRRVAHAARAARRLRPCLAALAAGRGAYILFVEHPERALFADCTCRRRRGTRRCAWLAPSARRTRTCSPTRATRGVTAPACASAPTATSSSKRPRTRRWPSTRATSPCASSSASARSATSRPLHRPTSQRLGERYGLTHVVTAGRLPLPLVFENAEFRVYALPPPVRLAGTP